MDEFLCYITLKCKECENNNCNYSPLGSYILQTSEQGCVREVDEDTAARFLHYKDEEIPF